MDVERQGCRMHRLRGFARHLDRPQIRDMEFIASNGETFVHEEKRDLLTEFEYIDREAPDVRHVNRDPGGRYR
jgi:glucoamylase